MSIADLPLSRLLMTVRSLPAALLVRRRPAGPPERPPPMLDGMLASGFLMLDERPEREIVLGVAGRPWRVGGGNIEALPDREAFQSYARPRSVRVAIDFALAPLDGGRRTRVTTETRIAGTDAAGTRTFRRYWRIVYPGSALIRRDMLRAAARLAEGRE
jgi:hypothetical protein